MRQDLYKYRTKPLFIRIEIRKTAPGSPEKKGNDHCFMKIVVCIGSSCHLKGSHQVVSCIKKLIKKNDLEDQIVLSGTFCMGNCQDDVCVSIDGEIFSVVAEETNEFFEKNVLTKLSDKSAK